MIKQLGIGEVHCCLYPTILESHGIGSCVCVYLYDYKLKITCACHIMNPDDDGTNRTIFAEPALKEVLCKLTLYGSNQTNLRAYVFGGANVLSNNTFNTGYNNIMKVQGLLKTLNIPVMHQDTGGSLPRTIRFNTDTGKYC